MSRKKNSDKLTRKEYLAKWRRDNPNYFKTYYKNHKKEIKESTNRYRNTTKGKSVIKTYEHSKKRKEGKRAYQQSLIKARNTLLSLKEKGRI